VLAQSARRELTGFGRASSSAATVVRAHNPEDLERIVGSIPPGGRVLARGLGSSYGDAAQCAGGTVIDCTALDRVIEADFVTGAIRVEAGCSIDALLRIVVPKGWFVPVTPGTRQVSVGGAIAADVHGKNHHLDGAFGAHVERLALVTSEGRRELSRSSDPDLFWATIGGMGLTGVIAEATLRLLPIETSLVRVDTERATDLDQCMARLDSIDRGRRYSVAWVDGVARGRSLGRSVITSADHAGRSDLSPPARARALSYDPASRAALPLTPPTNVLRRAPITAANELWYRKAPHRKLGELQSISSFFYPLDAMRDWNLLYGPRGFTQYQFVVPAESGEVVRRALEAFQRANLVPTLVVLKSFGPADPSPLSFPRSGWTLAVDLAAGSSGLGSVLDGLDELVADAGGRVYLAKDGRLRPGAAAAMYPRLGEWLATRERVDPGGIFVSDLCRRLRFGVGAQ